MPHSLFRRLVKTTYQHTSYRILLTTNFQHSKLSTLAVLPKVENESTTVIDHPTLDDLAVAFRKEHAIRLKDSNKEGRLFPPMLEFLNTPFSSTLRSVLKSEGYNAPTPTQAQSWPIALERRDIISVAKTGSGKTCGFLLPAIHKLMLLKPKQPAVTSRLSTSRGRTSNVYGRPPSVLVLAPTRELAVQILGEAQKFSRACGLTASCVYGGTSKGPQIGDLRAGVDILIATPGRCNDLAEMGVLKLSNISYLVLDEADRMLDMGFEPQIRSILEQTSPDRQSLFFSATWPREVQALASEFLTDPVHLTIGDSENLTANKSIEQNVMVVRNAHKEDELLALFDRLRDEALDAKAEEGAGGGIGMGGRGGKGSGLPKSLVFVARKHDCERLCDALRDKGYNADSLHGDKSQVRQEHEIEVYLV